MGFTWQFDICNSIIFAKRDLDDRLDFHYKKLMIDGML